MTTNNGTVATVAKGKSKGKQGRGREENTAADLTAETARAELIAGPTADGAGTKPPAGGKEGAGEKAGASENKKPAELTAQAAPDTAAEMEARAAALVASEKELEAQASKIGQLWAKVDRSAKEGNVQLGRLCFVYIAGCLTCLAYKYSDAMLKLRGRINLWCGEDHGTDIPRCIQTFFASEALGAEEFVRLPVRGQKEFAAFFSKDKEDKEQCYRIEPKHDELVRKVFRFVLSAPKETPEHLKGIERNRDGIVIGTDIAALLATVAKGADPFKAPDAKAPETKTPVPPAGGKDGEGKEKGTRDGENVPSVKLDAKPAIAAADLIKGLTEHTERAEILHAMGKASEVSAEYVENLLSGFAEAGRLDDLKRIVAFIGREIRVMLAMEKDKGLSRTEALRKMAA